MKYIHLLSSHEISFSYGSGRKDGRTEVWTDMEMAIFVIFGGGKLTLFRHLFSCKSS